MPFTWTCEEDDATAHSVDECQAHEKRAHDGRIVSWTLEFRQQGTPARRTWSCARCAGQVDREDDGSMLCDDCQRRPRASEPSAPTRDVARERDGRWLP